MDNRKGSALPIVIGIVVVLIFIGACGYFTWKGSVNSPAPAARVTTLDQKWIGYYKAYQFVNGNTDRRDFDLRIYDAADANGNPQAQLDIFQGPPFDYDSNAVSSSVMTVLPQISSGTLNIIFQSSNDPSVSYKQGDILFSLVPYTQYDATGTYSVIWGAVQLLPDTWDKGPILFEQMSLDPAVTGISIPPNLFRVGDQIQGFTVSALNKDQSGAVKSIDYAGSSTITIEGGYDFGSPRVINGNLCAFTDGLWSVQGDQTNGVICFANTLSTTTINTVKNAGNALVSINGFHESLGSANTQNTTQLTNLVEPSYSLTSATGGKTTLVDSTHGFSLVYPTAYSIQNGNSGESDFYLGVPPAPFFDGNGQELFAMVNQDEGSFFTVSVEHTALSQCGRFPADVNFGNPVGISTTTINGITFYEANSGDGGMSHSAEYSYYQAMGPHGCYAFNLGLEGSPDIDGSGGVSFSSAGSELQAILSSIKLF